MSVADRRGNSVRVQEVRLRRSSERMAEVPTVGFLHTAEVVGSSPAAPTLYSHTKEGREGRSCRKPDKEADPKGRPSDQGRVTSESFVSY
jgi:hypothetical protein